MGNRLLKLRSAALAAAVVSTTLALSFTVAKADSFLDEVTANVAKLANPQTEWQGPTSSPKPDANKLIVYMSQDEQNDASVRYGEAIKEAAGKLGWKVTIVDGRGTATGAIEATNQAIALKPDAIVIASDAAPLKGVLKEAASRGIAIVGVHAAALPGPQPELSMFYNIQTDPRDIGKAQADWIIAHSDGKARVIVTTDCSAAIACTKATATKDRLLQCKGCQVLEFNSSPFGEAQQRQPALIAAWVQKYGTPLYITSVGDYIADFQAPALRAGGIDPSKVILVSADGTKPAYERIRAGNQFQLITIPEPIGMQGYQAVDEINRALHRQQPSNFQQTPYLVGPDNIHVEGGDKDTYEPSNNYREHYMRLWGLAS
jgi:ribose transport system substrate-binding protein